MPVTVDIVGYARGLFDRASYAFDAKPGMAVRDVLRELSKHAGPGYDRRIYDAALDRMNEHIAVFVNSKEVRALEGLDTKLKDGDTITILPPMAGG